jgi:hypothetical protein
MRRATWSAVGVGLLTLFAGCYPERGLESTSQLSTVSTFFRQGFNFGTAHTYAMPDSVVQLIGEGGEEITHEFDALILSNFATQMQNRGYVRVDNTDAADPDLVLMPAITASDNVVWWSYPWCGYWGWYWPGYCPGWGPGYPGWVTGYTFTTGTVIALMVDRKNRDMANEILPAVWLGAANGVVGSSSETAAGITKGITQMFMQSLYIKTQ